MRKVSQEPLSRGAQNEARIAVFFTDEGFLVNGDPHPGIPMLVDTRTMRHIFLPSEWLIDVALVDGRCQSPLTWRAYAYDLRGFFEHFVSKNLNWKNPTEMQIGMYGTALAKRGISRNAVCRTMGVICRFYEWAQDRGSIAGLSLRTHDVRRNNRQLLAHINDSRLSARAIIIPKAHRRERLPRFYTVDDRKKMFEQLSERDQIIASWALFTGARQREICALMTCSPELCRK